MAIFTALATTLLTGTFLAGTIGVEIVAAGSAPFDFKFKQVYFAISRKVHLLR